MALTAGIVGLPNVGKSTLFNAITKAGAEAANYPFATIDPNVGMVEVPDERLQKLTEMITPKKTVPTTFEFTDIAGIVKGASKGEGLGNKFLSHIREVEAIVHVVRCFEDDNIVHVEGNINPLRDIETINLELIFSDIELLEKRIQKTVKLAKADASLKKEVEIMERIKSTLENSLSARTMSFNDEELSFVKTLNLLSYKPIIYIANVSEDDFSSDNSENPYVKAVAEFAKSENAECVSICAGLEYEISQLEEEEKLLRKVENLTRKAQKKEKIKVNKSDFDERLLKWLWEKGVFKPNRGNQFSPEKDYQLFLEVFQGGSWTKAEPKKKARMEEVLEKCIKPFLLGKPDDQLYLVKLGKEKIDYEQELRIQAEKERKKRDKIAKQYADNLVLAMGPAERAYQDYFGFTETLTQEERKWEKILFGKNRTERAIKAKQYQKELEKDQRIASQDPIERKQKQTWLLNSYFRELPEEKSRFARLLLEYRKSGEVPFSTEYLSDHLLDFFYKMKAFEFEIAPEQVRDFLKESLQTEHLSSAQESWIEGILLNCIKPFLERLLI